MANNYFQFKKFIVYHDKCAMKVGTDGVLIGAWANVNNVRTVLDVGTGTGVIALMVAQRSNSIIDAVDIDEDACNQAKYNITMSPWENRINVYKLSFQELALKTKEKYDLIISNPPFFTKSYLPPDKARAVARHSDLLPLKDIVLYSSLCLSDKGRIALIIPYDFFDYLEYLLLEKSLYINRITKVKPKPKKTFIRILVEASRKRENIIQKELTIETENRYEYSEEYKKLTKDFYLSL